MTVDSSIVYEEQEAPTLFCFDVCYAVFFCVFLALSPLEFSPFWFSRVGARVLVLVLLELFTALLFFKSIPVLQWSSSNSRGLGVKGRLFLSAGLSDGIRL